MEIFKLAYTQLMGIELSDKEGFLLKLDANPKMLNHIQTIHASASYALAESSSAQLLGNLFPEFSGSSVPIIRNATVSYKLPGQGVLYSKAKLLHQSKEEISSALLKKKRVMLEIEVKLYNEDNKMVLKSVFEWFVTLK